MCNRKEYGECFLVCERQCICLWRGMWHSCHILAWFQQIAQILPLRTDITCNLALLGSLSKKIFPTALHLMGEEKPNHPVLHINNRELGTAGQAFSRSQWFSMIGMDRTGQQKVQKNAAIWTGCNYVRWSHPRLITFTIVLHPNSQVQRNTANSGNNSA